MGLTEDIAQGLPEAVCTAEAGALVFANQAMHRLVGAASGSLVGRPLEALVPPDEVARIETVLAQRAGGLVDLPETFRLRLRRADGGELTCDVRFRRLGEALVLSARDASDQVRAETLMGQLAELAAGGHNLASADALLDAAEPIFQALGWRGAFTRLLPVGSVTLRPVASPPGDPVGDYARTLVGKRVPRDKTPVLHQVAITGRAIFLDNVPEFLAGPVAAATRLSQSLTSGHAYRSAWCPVRSGPRGEMTHLLAMAGRGMTEHDFVALQLFAAQVGAALDLEQARIALVRRERLAAIGEMAAVLAHEVRNPLGVVFNAVAGLRRTAQGEVNALLLDSLSEEAERLRRLVTDLLDYARPTTPELAPVPVGALLADAVAAARKDLTIPDLAPVHLEVAEGLPEVETDAGLLRRALVNLLVNALQHVPSGGAVTVSATRLPEGVRVRVFNDGAPIPAELAPRVFDPFFTTRAAGAGLGLAVVKRLVEELKGHVELEPTEAGVAFAITLPAAAAQMRAS